MPGVKVINAILTAVAVIMLLQVLACRDKAAKSEKVGKGRPVAVAAATPHFGTAPLTVEFDARSSHVPGGGTLTYEWDFDDKKMSEGVTVTHTFKASGTYMVMLTVTDSSGLKGTAWTVIIVN